MTQVTLGNGVVDSSAGLKLRSNGTTEAVDISTGQVVTLAKDAVVNGLTVGKGAGAVSSNTSVGASALATNSVGTSLTAVGSSALNAATGSDSTGVGFWALKNTSTGVSNTALGSAAAYQNTTGSYNTALGKDALQANTTASENTAVGYQALYTNTASYNVAVGAYSLKNNTTGAYNVAVGTETAGSNSVLYANTTGSYNVGIGISALASNTTASNNTAVGYQAGYSNTTGAQNTFIGRVAGNAVTTGGYNTMLGYAAGNLLSTGTTNTFIGQSSGELITTGSKNTILGSYSGNQGGLDIRTASNYIVLSDGDGNPRIITDGSGRTGFNGLIPYASYNLSIPVTPAGNAGVRFQASTTGTSYAMEFYTSDNASHGYISYTTSGTSYNTTSDYRLKHDINPMTGALAKVAALKPCTYKWNADGSEGEGFIAHELAEVCPHAVTGEKDAVNDDGSIKPQGIDTSFLVATLTAAIQELKAEFDAYKEAHP